MPECVCILTTAVSKVISRFYHATVIGNVASTVSAWECASSYEFFQSTASACVDQP